MTAAQQRTLQRAVHLATAVVLIIYIYVPLGPDLSATMRWIGVPILVLTGVLMWQMPRIRRLMRPRRADRSARAAACAEE